MVYVFRCTSCGLEWEEFYHEFVVDQSCPACYSAAKRAMDRENIHVISDIEPYYNLSTDTYVKSRKDWREQLASNDAHDKDLFMNSNPSSGRLTKEERAKNEQRSLPSQKTIFERRKEPGWGKFADSETEVETVGEANYKEIVKQVKQRGVK